MLGGDSVCAYSVFWFCPRTPTHSLSTPLGAYPNTVILCGERATGWCLRNPISRRLPMDIFGSIAQTGEILCVSTVRNLLSGVRLQAQLFPNVSPLCEARAMAAFGLERGPDFVV